MGWLPGLQGKMFLMDFGNLHKKTSKTQQKNPQGLQATQVYARSLNSLKYPHI
jgi:hypothetical protein